MHLFFVPDVNEGIVTLPPDESLHCARVLRLRPGQQIGLVNGKGVMAVASLLDVNTRGAQAQVVSFEINPARNFSLHLAVAPTKNIDRYEWFIEKATECGIEAITPIICENSERTTVKTDRLQKIALAAMKQSQRTWLPTINEPVKFRDFLKPIEQFTNILIAHCSPGHKDPLEKLYTPGSDVLILIGPEGDFTHREVTDAMSTGARSITLGHSRLRTETASLVACFGVNFMNGEFLG